jgi:hypothetical protein
MKTFKEFITESDNINIDVSNFNIKLSKTIKHSDDDQAQIEGPTEKQWDILYNGKIVGNITKIYSIYGNLFNRPLPILDNYSHGGDPLQAIRNFLKSKTGNIWLSAKSSKDTLISLGII